MELFKLLEEYTNSNMGEWYLSYNEHHTNYINEGNYPDDFDYDNDTIEESNY